MMAESPRLKARITGAFYMLVVVTSLIGFVIGGKHASPELHRLGLASDLLSGVASVVVAVLLFQILKPVNNSIAMIAAAFNLLGVAHSANSLAFFGPYCILTGYLVYKSGFLPRTVGVLMVLAGLGLLTNAFTKIVAPGIAAIITPYGFALDVGEIVFALWLLIFGLDTAKWEMKAATADDGN